MSNKAATTVKIFAFGYLTAVLSIDAALVVNVPLFGWDALSSYAPQLLSEDDGIKHTRPNLLKCVHQTFGDHWHFIYNPVVYVLMHVLLVIAMFCISSSGARKDLGGQLTLVALIFVSVPLVENQFVIWGYLEPFLLIAQLLCTYLLLACSSTVALILGCGVLLASILVKNTGIFYAIALTGGVIWRFLPGSTGIKVTLFSLGPVILLVAGLINGVPQSEAHRIFTGAGVTIEANPTYIEYSIADCSAGGYKQIFLHIWPNQTLDMAKSRPPINMDFRIELNAEVRGPCKVRREFPEGAVARLDTGEFEGKSRFWEARIYPAAFVVDLAVMKVKYLGSNEFRILAADYDLPLKWHIDISILENVITALFINNSFNLIPLLFFFLIFSTVRSAQYRKTCLSSILVTLSLYLIVLISIGIFTEYGRLTFIADGDTSLSRLSLSLLALLPCLFLLQSPSSRSLKPRRNQVQP